MSFPLQSAVLLLILPFYFNDRIHAMHFRSYFSLNDVTIYTVVQYCILLPSLFRFGSKLLYYFSLLFNGALYASK